MKKILLPLVFTTMLVIFFSCENKHNCNGQLDGNWQLIAWTRNANDSLVATNHTKSIYYVINLQLIKIWDTKETPNYLCSFIKRNDSIILKKVYSSPFDEEKAFSDMNKYGVSDDGAFKIIKNDASKLILRNSINTLTFRKY